MYSFLSSPLRSRLRMLVAGERSDDVVLLLGEIWSGMAGAQMSQPAAGTGRFLDSRERANYPPKRLADHCGAESAGERRREYYVKTVWLGG